MTGEAKRIVFVLPGYPRRPVGGFRVVYEFAGGLAAHGHAVTVVHARRLGPPGGEAGGSFSRRLRRLGVNVRDLVSKPTVRWMTVDPRVRLAYAPDPGPERLPDADVVFATAWQTAVAAEACAPRHGVRHYLVQDFGDYFGPREKLEATWRLPFRKVAVSRWIRDQIVAAGGGDDVAVIPPGIDHERFRLIAPIDVRPPRVCMMYSRATYKAAHDGVHALVECRRRHPEMEAEVFGPGPRPADLPAWIRYRRNVPEEGLVDLYNRCRIVLCSSLAEGFALPPAEASACGCAVVSTDCGGNREYAEHDVTALLSAPGDPAALAAHLEALLADDGRRRRLAEAGRARVLRFRWDRSTDLLENFLTAV